MKTYTSIKYIKPNIGHFPQLTPLVNHGFSWGKEAGNMSFTYGKKEVVKDNIRNFLDQLHMGTIYQSFFIDAQHDTGIIDIENSDYKPKPKGIALKCDAMFTTKDDVTITVKPADCITTIIYGEIKNSSVTRIIHTGRRGVNKLLIPKAISHLEEKYSTDPSNIKLFILPHLFPENRKFTHIDELDQKVWRGFITEKDGFFYPDEAGLAIKQYRDAGIRDENILLYKVNTYEAAKRGEGFSQKYEWDMVQQGHKVRKGRFIVGIRKKINSTKPNYLKSLHSVSVSEVGKFKTLRS